MVWNKLNTTQHNMQEIQQEKFKTHALVSTTKWTWLSTNALKIYSLLAHIRKKQLQ
jgi:hypothetical protein